MGKTSINDEIKGILAGQQAAERLFKEEQGTRKQRALAVRDRIVKGESTGDRILDYLIVTAEGFDQSTETMAAPYRKIANELKGKTGQLVLVIKRERNAHKHITGRGQLQESDYHVDATYTLAVLVGDELSLNAVKHQEGFPTAGYASWGDGVWSERKLAYTDGPLWYLSFLDGFWRTTQKVAAGDDTASALEIVVGDELVLSAHEKIWRGRRSKSELKKNIRSAAALLEKKIA